VAAVRLGDGTLTLGVRAAQVGDDEAPLAATVTGDGVAIALNARYLAGVVPASAVLRRRTPSTAPAAWWPGWPQADKNSRPRAARRSGAM
jgi:hypothetical protein